MSILITISVQLMVTATPRQSVRRWFTASCGQCRRTTNQTLRTVGSFGRIGSVGVSCFIVFIDLIHGIFGVDFVIVPSEHGFIWDVFHSLLHVSSRETVVYKINNNGVCVGYTDCIIPSNLNQFESYM